MRRKINRIGEEGINNFGSKMIISRYNSKLDISYLQLNSRKIKYSDDITFYLSIEIIM